VCWPPTYLREDAQALVATDCREATKAVISGLEAFKGVVRWSALGGEDMDTLLRLLTTNTQMGPLALQPSEVQNLRELPIFEVVTGATASTVEHVYLFGGETASVCGPACVSPSCLCARACMFSLRDQRTCTPAGERVAMRTEEFVMLDDRQVSDAKLESLIKLVTTAEGAMEQGGAAEAGGSSRVLKCKQQLGVLYKDLGVKPLTKPGTWGRGCMCSHGWMRVEDMGQGARKRSPPRTSI
jgi:hypothetical protein